MTFTESNTLEQMILDAVNKRGLSACGHAQASGAEALA